MAEVMVPRWPSRTACWTFSVERSNRCWEMTATVFPERFSASMMRSAAARVMSIGFSTTTCFPASRAATAPSACTPLGVQIVTASMSSRRSTASRSVVACGHCLAGGQQRVLDLDVDGVRAQLRVAFGERGHPDLHEVGGVPGQPQGGRADRLDDVEHALRDVAVDVLLVLVKQHDPGGLGARGE